jgi:hypothetical protein
VLDPEVASSKKLIIGEPVVEANLLVSLIAGELY